MARPAVRRETALLSGAVDQVPNLDFRTPTVPLLPVKSLSANRGLKTPHNPLKLGL
jgi:hypothetical protein